MPDSIPSLPDWLSRGMADLFPAGDPSDADQALAARLAQADKEGRPLRVKLG
ncbi:MAG: tyrosine--tRNA ligase, partial [Synechococcus sp.]